MGRAAWIIGMEPMNGEIGFIESAQLWIDRETHAVLKIALTGIPFRGFDDVWKEAAAFALFPQSGIEVLFGVENEGIRYPSRTILTIQYATPIGLLDKIVIETSYKKYRFFSVATEHRIR
jgi:hypothetical protein